MSKFNNRLSEKLGCKPCTKGDEPKKEITPVITDTPKPEVDINTSGSIESAKCWNVKVKHIVKVGNKILIVFNDCSYLEADESVLDINVCQVSNSEVSNQLEQVKEQVKALKEISLTKADFIQETHHSFDGDEMLIQTLKFKE